MARFDVYSYQGSSTSTPFVLDVQADVLDGLDTRVVIPLSIPSNSSTKLPKNLTPSMNVNGIQYILETTKISAVQKNLLKTKIGSLQTEQTTIISAMDFLFQGF